MPDQWRTINGGLIEVKKICYQGIQWSWGPGWFVMRGWGTGTKDKISAANVQAGEHASGVRLNGGGMMDA